MVKKNQIACSIDDNYVDNFIVFITSIVRNNKKLQFNFNIIIESLKVESKEKIKAFFLNNPKSTFNFIKVDPSLLDGIIVYGHVSRATYYRILLPEILGEEIDKILYLDVDLIVKGDIGLFWEIELSNYSHLGVENMGIDDQFKKNLGMSPSQDYFNAGVLMINLMWWRKNSVYQRSFEYISTYPERIILWDQDVLNVVLQGKWKELPFEYNAQESIFRKDLPTYRHEGFLKAYFNPKIIHYTGGGHSKPWHKECRHELKNEYAYYHYKSRVLNSPIWIRIFKLDIPLTKYTLPLVFINRMILKLEWVSLLLFKSIKHQIRLKFLKK